MPTTTPSSKEHQERWQEIVSDPHLRELPYTVETNDRGQIVLRPHQADHTTYENPVCILSSSIHAASVAPLDPNGASGMNM